VRAQVSVLVLGTWLWVPACGGSSSFAGGSATPADPTPLTKCKVAVSQESPLVTEWPASEKARLESLTARQVVAVQYSGCEMRIVDRCRVEGSYGWRATTLATDTVEIADADELYAKLPLGAVGLEGQLERSGRLAVRTTVSGHLEAAELPSDLPRGKPCEGVTHIVKGISVGAFRLLSGGSVSAGGGAQIAGFGAGGRRRSQEQVMREAGDPSFCAQSDEHAPHPQCASPIQVFLVPVDDPAAEPSAPLDDQQRARELGGVMISFPAREDEWWSLRDSEGRVLCDLPCSRWVPPASGYRLERRADHKIVALPDRFAARPGTNLQAEYKPERGYPLFAALTFYGVGVPAAIGGAVLLTLAFTDDGETATGRTRTGFYVGSSIMFFSFTVGTGIWYWLSDFERFKATEKRSAKQQAPEIMFGPGAIGGRF
jgi:hypothetical protein